MEKLKPKIAIIGCGTMGCGIARILGKQYPLILYDRHAEKAESLLSEFNALVCSDLKDAVQGANLIILAIQPQNFLEIAKELMGKLRNGKIVASIMAGVSTKMLKQHLGNISVLRVMPNVPCLYGKGVVGLVESSDITAEKKPLVEEVFSLLGSVHWIPENKADSLTTITASGPAFTYVMIESIIDAGIALGFSAELSKELALEMLAGAVETVKVSGKHPGQLKWDVATPAGSTIAGLKQMEDEAVRSGIINTFLAANERLQEFS